MEKRYLGAVATVALILGCFWLFLEVIERRNLERDCAAEMLATSVGLSLDPAEINEAIQLCVRVGGVESYEEALRKYETAVAADAAVGSVTRGSTDPNN